MAILTAQYQDAAERLPAGASLVIHRVEWEDYERLLAKLGDRPRLRVSYDAGRLEIMTPLPEHEAFARFIDDVVRIWAEALGQTLEKRGSATWKTERLAKGVEADACYYLGNADRIIGRTEIDLERDPPPDLVVEVDVTNESLGKFPIYAALSVQEIWRYDGERAHFYELAAGGYREIFESPSLAGMTPALLTEALEESKAAGQTAALRALRHRCP